MMKCLCFITNTIILIAFCEMQWKVFLFQYLEIKVCLELGKE
jgi:hypothetical protein